MKHIHLSCDDQAAVCCLSLSNLPPLTPYTKCGRGMFGETHNVLSWAAGLQVLPREYLRCDNQPPWKLPRLIFFPLPSSSVIFSNTSLSYLCLDPITCLSHSLSSHSIPYFSSYSISQGSSVISWVVLLSMEASCFSEEGVWNKKRFVVVLYLLPNQWSAALMSMCMRKSGRIKITPYS